MACQSACIVLRNCPVVKCACILMFHRHTPIFQPLHQLYHESTLRAGAVDVVIVDGEDWGRIRRLRSLEGDVDEALAEGIVKDGRSHGAVIADDLVDYIPGVSLSFSVVHCRGYVVLDDGGQSSAVEAAVRNPANEKMTCQLSIMRVHNI